MLTELPVAIRKCVGNTEAAQPDSLAAVAVEHAHKLVESGIPLGMGLAASFDLLVASRYYDEIKPENWLWCEESKLDVYPFLNACPMCAAKCQFIYHEGNKLKSGQIGPITAACLRRVLVEHYRVAGKQEITVASGHEPADLAILDHSRKMIFLAEVKASPLFVPPIVTAHTGDAKVGDTMPSRHHRVTLRGMPEREVAMAFPDPSGGLVLWTLPGKGLGTAGWAERAARDAISSDASAFEKYVRAWMHLWKLYIERDRDDAAFWFTGACGLPSECGSDWPRDANRKTRGSISDSKTSVGMDRTDDIKKGTFQVFELGLSLRLEQLGEWQLRIGLASNLHAARHHGDYLAQYERIVWSWLADDAKPPEDWYNLFDGIVAFSKSYTHDAWLEGVLDWQ